MSTAGAHVPAPGCSPRWSGVPNVSSSTRFTRLCSAESSLIGSHNRTIAIPVSFPPAGPPAGTSVFSWGRLFLPRVLVLRVHHVALLALFLRGVPGGPAARGGGGLLVHVLRQGVGLLDQPVRRRPQRPLVL